MKFVICSILAALFVFLLGGWMSNWALLSIAFWPWALVSLVAGIVGCFRLIRIE